MAFCGKDFLVQHRVSTGPDVYTTIGGMRSTSLTINNEQVDVTDKGSVPWRQLLACGVRSMSISLSGVMSTDTVAKSMMLKSTQGTIETFKLISGLGDTYVGQFLIASCQREGEYNGAEQYSLTLESAGAIAYTAAP